MLLINCVLYPALEKGRDKPSKLPGEAGEGAWENGQDTQLSPLMA